MSMDPFASARPTPSDNSGLTAAAESPSASAAAAAAPQSSPEEVTIAGEGYEPVVVSLVGKKYRIKPPKAALGLKLAVRAKQADEDPSLMALALDEWIDRAFSAEDAADVKYRMYESTEDDLDLPHVMSLMEQMIERVTDNPSS